LSFIVSEGDHRLSFVEPWATERMSSLQALLPGEVTVGDVLHYLSEDAIWDKIEGQLGQQVVRVYALPQERVRLDSTSVAVYHDPVQDSLFAYGLSIDHRPDLAQLKVMLVALDPLGLPLATRATLAAGDTYLTPLSMKGQQGRLLEELLAPVWQKQQALTEVYDPHTDPEPAPLLIRGYETRRSQSCLVKEQPVEWEERVLVIYSPALAK
jgi:hypothetical protein